jgi:hypothetical protein
MRRTAPVLFAVALGASALTSAAGAHAAVRPQSASCYDWSYNYSINSTQIQVTATWDCGGTAPQPWMILQRQTAGGGWQYVTDSNSPYPHNGVTYNCVGTTPNTYQVGPIFSPDGSSNSFHQFTDNCG